METNKVVEGVIKAGLRSIAASFPGAASLAQAWNEYESRIQLVRIEDLFCSLREYIGNIEDRIKGVEEYILRSGEVPPLIERTINLMRGMMRGTSLNTQITQSFR